MNDMVPRPRQTLLRLALSFGATFLGLELLLRAVGETQVMTAPMDQLLLRVALAFVGIDLALGVVLVWAVKERLAAESKRTRTSAAPPKVSVLLPVWNEGAHVASTIEAWLPQTGVELELLVGDDGSTDGAMEALEQRYAGHARVRVLRFPHAGKGATLNALARHAKHPVLVTIDADTHPIDGALAQLAEAFLDEEVDLATGVVAISNGRQNWLLGHQAAEYLKNAFSRIAWSTLDALEQVPGAFAGIRASTFQACGGFPTDSLTEDYELTWRAVEAGIARGRPPKVVTVLAAQVFTEGPSTVRGFVAQRTRWFAGFLTTLFRFRHLIFEPRAGSFGLVRFPLKVLDAVLPVLAFASLIILARGGLVAALGVSTVSLTIFAVRWVWDLTVFGLALHASRYLGDPRASALAAPSRAQGWWLTAQEALTYVWFKHAAAFRGIAWAIARVRKWEASRETATQRASSEG